MKTLRSRVLLGTTAAVACVLIVAGWALYALVERALVREVDRALAAQARVLASTISQTGRSLDLEFVELDLREFADPKHSEFFQLRASGQALYGFPSMEEQSFVPESTSAELSTEWIDLAADTRGRLLINGCAANL